MKITYTKKAGGYQIKATLENGTTVERFFPEAAVQSIMKVKSLTEKGAVEYLAVHTWVGQDSIPPPSRTPQAPSKAPVKPPVATPPPPPPQPPASPVPTVAPKTPPPVPSPPSKVKDATVEDLLEELEDDEEDEDEEEEDDEDEEEEDEGNEDKGPESPAVTRKDLEGMTYNEKIKLATDMHYFDKKNRSRTDLAVTTWLRLEIKK